MSKVIREENIKEWVNNQSRLSKKATLAAIEEMAVEDDKPLAKWEHVKGNIYACTNCALVWFMSNEHTPEENEMFHCPKCGAAMSEENDNG